MNDIRGETQIKRNIGIGCMLAICFLTGCSDASVQAWNQDSSAETTIASTVTEPPETVTSTIMTATEITDFSSKPKTITTDAETKIHTEQSETVQPVTEPETSQISALINDTFTGILIDEDCSLLVDLPEHDLPCMLMDTCRASGYGLDIQQSDGSWRFFSFDENGQNLSWDYLIHTTRMDHLYVTVKGTLIDGVIAVSALEEVP